MSFLGLPLEIRMTIYASAGLQRPCPIDLLHEASLKRDRVPGRVCTTRYSTIIGTISRPGEPDCHCPELPTSLLRLCRQVHKEALSILYGNNTFIVLCRNHTDLQIFGHLPRSGLKLMRWLMVRLNCWPCPNGHDFYTFLEKSSRGFLDWCPQCQSCDRTIDDSDPPLWSLERTGADIIRAWLSTSMFLAQLITPGQLHLSLIADVIDVPEARTILEKLFDLPRLKQLDLRLGRQRDWRLQDVACDAARILTGAYRHEGVFPFERLPDELQMRILEATDLFPNRKAESKPANVHRRSLRGHLEFKGPSGREYEDRLYTVQGWGSPDTAYHDYIYIRNNKLDILGPRGTNRASCCRQCNPAAFGCCCPVRYAAVSAYCSCRLIPYAMFYTSKKMYHQATQVFYSRNVFVFHQGFSSTATFLEQLRPSLARLLREIHIHPPFAGYATEDFVFASSHERDLEKLVRVIKQNLCLHTLKLTFITEDFRNIALTLDKWQKLYEEHCVVGKHLRLLNGIPRLSFRTFSTEWDDALKCYADGGNRLETAPAPFIH